MEKKQYIVPRMEQVNLALEGLMIIASPGVAGEYDPNKPIDAKGGLFDDEEEEEENDWRNAPHFSVWDD